MSPALLQVAFVYLYLCICVFVYGVLLYVYGMSPALLQVKFLIHYSALYMSEICACEFKLLLLQGPLVLGCMTLEAIT